MGLGTGSSPYSAELSSRFQEVAAGQELPLFCGIYAAVTGPCYETPAEIRAPSVAGADAVGMSTAHEIETGHRLGIHCAAISCITNRAAGLSESPLNHQEVLHEAGRQADRLSNLIESRIDPIA